MQAQKTATLYDRLGGIYNIATVVDDLVARIMADPRLNANPRVNEAHHRVLPAGFKYYVTELCVLSALLAKSPGIDGLQKRHALARARSQAGMAIPRKEQHEDG
jgi:hypothetical protein